MVIQIDTKKWEFYSVPGNGWMLRYKDQEHPTALIGSSGYTFFADEDFRTLVDPHEEVTYLVPHIPGTFRVTQPLYELLTSFFLLHQQVLWNYSQFRDMDIPTIVRESKILRYLDLIRSYYYGYEIKYGNRLPAMRWTSQKLWFLTEGGMCKCGLTRMKCQGARFPHQFECDYSYGVTEEIAHMLECDEKVPKKYDVEIP